MCLRCMQKLKMATKNGGKIDFGKRRQMQFEIFTEIALSCAVSKVMRLTQKLNMVTRNSGKRFLVKKKHYTLRAKHFIGIALSRTVSEINVFFYTKFKMAGKQSLPKSWQMVLRIP